MMSVFGIFIMTRLKPFAGALLPFIICTLHFTGLMQENIAMLVNTWEFDPPSSFEVLIFMVVG